MCTCTCVHVLYECVRARASAARHGHWGVARLAAVFSANTNQDHLRGWTASKSNTSTRTQNTSTHTPHDIMGLGVSGCSTSSFHVKTHSQGPRGPMQMLHMLR